MEFAMSKKNALLADALPAVCRAVTRQKGIKLVFQGPPRTDGKTIYSDPLPIDADEDQRKMIIGDIDHECGHILFTDFEYHRNQMEALPEDRKEFLHSLANAIEDTMEERRMAEEYIGCRQTLAESAELLMQKHGPEAIIDVTPGKLLSNYIDAWGRVHVLGQQVEPCLEYAKEALVEQLDEREVRYLDALLTTHLYSVDNTRDTWDLVKRVEQFLEDIDEDDENDEEQGDSGQPQDQKASQGQDQPSGSEQGQDPAQSTGQGQDPNPGQPQGQDTGQSQGPSNPAKKENAQAMLNDKQVDATPFFDRRKDAKEAAEEAAMEHYVPEADSGTVGGFSEGDPEFANADLGDYRKLRDELSGEIEQLKRRIVQEYQTRTHRRHVAAEQGRLDGRSLVRAMTGDTQVYRKRVHRMIPQPAVSLVVDSSGSMYGREMELAKQAAIVVLETNEHLGVKTALHVFAGGSSKTVKTHEQPLNTVRHQVAGIEAGGGTPMSEALWESGLAIARRREERKLIFLVTDGQPNDPQGTREIASMLERSGIELYGVGIASDAVADYCSHAAVVDGAEEIAPAILSAMQKSLLRVA